MASRSPRICTAPITLQLIGPESWTEVPALLSYDPLDPFAVRIAFGEVGPDGDDTVSSLAEDGVCWLVGRELVEEGLRRPAGDGDVRVWPSVSTADVLFLHLRAPSGEALFELSRAAMAAFLRGTAALVPLGAEAAALRIDDELTALLSNGGADP